MAKIFKFAKEKLITPTMQHAIKKHRSYSLIEILVAATVIILITLGVVSISNAAYRNSIMANHRLQIAFFAQEKMEIIRNMRDTGLIITPPPSTGISAKDKWQQFFMGDRVGETTDNSSDPKPGDVCNGSASSHFNVKFSVRDGVDDSGSARIDQFRVVNLSIPTGQPGEPVAVGNPESKDYFKFYYYLQCQKLNNIFFEDDENHMDDIPNTIQTHGNVLRFRIKVTWYEYGKENTYYLNNYLTNLRDLSN